MDPYTGRVSIYASYETSLGRGGFAVRIGNSKEKDSQ